MDHQPLINIGVRALEIIREPEHWTTKVYARDAGGIECPPIDPDACTWCALGAIHRAARELYGANDETWESADSVTAFLAGLIDEDSPASHDETVANFNDDEGHAAVIALFASALEQMRACTGGAHVS